MSEYSGIQLCCCGPSDLCCESSSVLWTCDTSIPTTASFDSSITNPDSDHVYFSNGPLVFNPFWLTPRILNQQNSGYSDPVFICRYRATRTRTIGPLNPVLLSGGLSSIDGQGRFYNYGFSNHAAGIGNVIEYFVEPFQIPIAQVGYDGPDDAADQFSGGPFYFEAGVKFRIRGFVAGTGITNDTTCVLGRIARVKDGCPQLLPYENGDFENPNTRFRGYARIGTSTTILGIGVGITQIATGGQAYSLPEEQFTVTIS